MLPCAQVHWKILPKIYKAIAFELETNKIPRKRIAKILGTTQAAISQYLTGKRGTGKLSRKAQIACKKLAKKIIQNKINEKSIDVEMARIIAIQKKSKEKIHPCIVCMR